ncbi:MAG TPA: hypothetical protein PK967_06550 [Candidatus Hydrogenedentes bacterium]|nr:hypothetical protein [Candidatus Hydrogenedentota bacterium]
MIVILLAVFTSAASAPDVSFKTALPQVYLIDYAATHVGNPQYLETIAEAPPDILHVGHDLAFKSHLGPCRGFGSFPASYDLMSPDECDVEIARLREYVDTLHRAGARTVIPYICDVFLFGDHEKRTGFWTFYDHWADYERFGFGKKPETDPIEWMQSDERRPFERNDMFVYEPCINHPDWQRYLRAIVRLVAQCGYDGVFVDVNSFRCPHACCRSLFWKYLRERYSAEEVNKLFGFDSPKSVRLNENGKDLLAVETCRFRAWSFARLFTMLKNEGAAIHPGFMLLPNLSPMAHIAGVRQRIGNGQDVGRWATVCDWLMFEEMQQPGLFGAGTISDCTLQYKLAFANRVRGGMLLYHARDSDGVSLAMAEAGAGGGGALIQGGYESPEARNRYRAFWRDNRDFFEGYEPWSQDGVCYFRDELYWGNLAHLHAIYRLRDHLARHHVLFDFIVDGGLKPWKLRGYKAVILPFLTHLNNRELEALREYVEEGGVLVAMGDCGTFDELGRRRARSPFVRWTDSANTEGSSFVRHVKKGAFLSIDDLDAHVPPSPFNLYDLGEEEANDIEIVMRHAMDAPAIVKESSPLLELIAPLAKTDLTVAGPETPRTVQVSAFVKQDAAGGSLVLHLLNYNLPIHGLAKSGPPVPVHDITIDVPLPQGWRAISAETIAPDAPPENIAFTKSGLRTRAHIPQLNLYKVLRIRCKTDVRP